MLTLEGSIYCYKLLLYCVKSNIAKVNLYLNKEDMEHGKIFKTIEVGDWKN